MTDKQIIINGVNVSECECIIEDYQQVNNFKGGYEHIKNVCELGERGSEYYNLFCKDNPNCYYKQLKRKEQECEELKHKVELMMDCASCKIDEYKQALDEIEEIAEDMNTECFYDDFECKDCDMKNGCTYFSKKQILQKISEK